MAAFVSRSLSVSFAIALALLSSVVSGQNSVVVIPLSGDDIKPLQNIVTVSPENGDFSNPVAAMDSISDASSSNRYILVIGPGVYTLPEPLIMKSYVDVVGAGPNATVLQGGFSAASVNSSDAAVISGASFAAISNLSITNTGGIESASVGLRNPQGRVSDLHIEVSGGNAQYGIYASGTSPSIENVSIEVRDGTSSQYGLHFSSGRSRISGVEIQMENGSNSSEGMYFNAGVYNIADAIIRVEDGFQQRGIFVNTGDAVIGDSQILLSDASNRQEGIYANAAVEIQISNVLIQMDPPSAGSISQYGIFSNTSVDSVVSNVNIDIVDGAGSEYGVYQNTSSAQGMYSNMRVTADTNAVRVSSVGSNDTLISNSYLRGPSAANAVTGNLTYCSFVFVDTDKDGVHNSQLDSVCEP